MPTPAKKKDPKAERREKAVRSAARELGNIELGMEHADSEHSITTSDLRRALERAYELGRKDGMS